MNRSEIPDSCQKPNTMNLQKPKKYRSKKITQSAKGETCTLRITNCSGTDTTVFAHAPSKYKGTSTKSDDWWGCYSCYNCHMMADGLPESNARDWLRAIFETQRRLIEKGLIKID